MRHKPAITLLLLLSGIVLLAPTASSEESAWSHDDYLYLLEISSFDESVDAGEMGALTVEVGANTPVVVHIEFKGRFSWGDWVFHSSEVQVGAGESTVASELYVPYKVMIEPASYFYYYVYVTFPLSHWSSDVWGVTQNVSVMAPDDVSHEELVACMSHLAWLVESSSLPPRERGRLLSRLDSAGEMIDSAFKIGGNLNKLHGALGQLQAFIDKLTDDDDLSAYLDAEIWIEQASFIIERIHSV
jgi:hypothetical protein